MKRLIATAAAVLLLAGCGASTDGGGGNGSTEAPTAANSTAPAAESGDLKFAQVKVKKNSLDLYEGTMRATNITGEKRSGSFTVTAFDKKGGTLGTLSGVANDVAANKTVTVTLLSTDDLKGAVKYEVQTDASF